MAHLLITAIFLSKIQINNNNLLKILNLLWILLLPTDSDAGQKCRILKIMTLFYQEKSESDTVYYLLIMQRAALIS